MLASSLGPLTKAVRTLPADGRRWASSAAAKPESRLTFSTDKLRYTELVKIKKERFGQSLDEFKTAYEAPLVKLHAEIRQKKTREAKKLQNKLATRDLEARRREKKMSKESQESIDTREFRLQDQLKELLKEEELTLAQFITSGDPRVAEMVQKDNLVDDYRLNFDAFDAEAVESDSWWSHGNLNATLQPARLKLAPGERWHWEKQLPSGELDKIISSELLSCGLPIREDVKIVSGGLEPLNEEDFEGQGERLATGTNTATGGLMKALRPEWMPVDVSSPAVMPAEEAAVKQYKKKSNRVSFVSDRTPFVLETDEFPMLTGMTEQGNSKLPSAFMQRKAKLRIHLPTLKLPLPVRMRLEELSGTRYSKEKGGVVTIVSDSKPTRDENISNVYKLTSALFNEAWKADLNYVALGDVLPPHEQIQREIELEAEKNADTASLELASFVKPNHFTFFSIASYPTIKSLDSGRASVKEIISGILSPSAAQ